MLIFFPKIVVGKFFVSISVNLHFYNINCYVLLILILKIFSNVFILGAHDGRGPQQVLVGSSLTSTSLPASLLNSFKHDYKFNTYLPDWYVLDKT